MGIQRRDTHLLKFIFRASHTDYGKHSCVALVFYSVEASEAAHIHAYILQ